MTGNDRFGFGGRISAAVGWAVAGASLAMMAQPQRSDVIQAAGFELVDEDAAVHARLAMSEAGPRLTFFDAEGRHRIALGMQVTAPGLEIFSSRGSHRIEVRDLNGRPVVRLYDDDGRARAQMLINEEGPQMELLDENGGLVERAADRILN